MYTVLLAEDEPLVRRGIKSMVDWEKLDMRVCAECSDGAEALQACRRLKPDLIIFDEPTTALDVVVQYNIIRKITALKDEMGFSILFITHDLGLAVQYSDRIGVIRHGTLLETGLPDDLLRHPAHPYTKRLFASTPSLMTSLDDIRRLGPVEADS